MFHDLFSFTIIFKFFYIYFLSVSSTASQKVIVTSPKVTVTVEPPGIAQTSANFFLYGIEDFDKVLLSGRTARSYETYVSYFNSSGYESSLRGTYNDAKSAEPIRGMYSKIEIAMPTSHESLGSSDGRFAYHWRDCELQLTSTGPFGVDYFGFQGHLQDPNRLEFYFGSEMIFELKLKDVIKSLKAMNTQYFYNPNPEYEGLKKRWPYELVTGRQKWPYAFVNIFFEKATIDKVKLLHGGYGLRTDIHAVGTYKDKSGTQVPVTTNYIPPTKKPMVAPKKPTVPIVGAKKPTGIAAGAAVRIEPPGRTDTSILRDWFGRQDFDGVLQQHYASSHTFDFEPKGLVKGTYSAPFDILPNSTLEENPGGYFSAANSLLSLTVTGGRKPTFFGLYLNPLRQYSTLEFSLNGYRIIVLDLGDIFNFIENKQEYLLNPAIPRQPGSKPSTDRFVFVDIIFHEVTYDAVRIRYWNAEDITAKGVVSDNHIVGSFRGVGKSEFVKRIPIKLELLSSTPKTNNNNK